MGRMEEYRLIICMLPQIGSGGPATHNTIRNEIQIMIQTAGAAMIIYDADGWRRVLAAKRSRSFAALRLQR